MKELFFKSAVSLCLAISAFKVDALPVTFTGFANGYQQVTFSVPGASGAAATGGFVTNNEGQTFISYCVDLFQYLPAWGQINQTYTPINAATFFADRFDDVGRLFSGFSSAVSGNALNSAAFQIALWEIRYEATQGAYDVSSGTAVFTANAAVIEQAQFWLSQLGNMNNHVSLNVLTSGVNQDVVWETPEPPVWTLMLVSVLGLIGWSKRRTRG
jgi:hypothetical protein